MTTLNILMVVSEAVPYSKTGGLGDVGGALPGALARLGHGVTVVTPRYRGVEDGVEVAAFARGAWPGALDCRILERRHEDGVRFWLVDCPAYFGREKIYGAGGGDYPDNSRRFSLLPRAALECAVRMGKRPSIIHAHDWQTGLVPVYLKERFGGHPAFQGTGTVFTIHNLAYQGIFGREVLSHLDLPREVFTGDGLVCETSRLAKHPTGRHETGQLLGGVRAGIRGRLRTGPGAGCPALMAKAIETKPRKVNHWKWAGTVVGPGVNDIDVRHHGIRKSTDVDRGRL